MYNFAINVSTFILTIAGETRRANGMFPAPKQNLRGSELKDDRKICETMVNNRGYALI
jgi:hypothetical protein